VRISYDPVKRAATLHDRGLDFEDAAEVFAGRTLDLPDERLDYGEVPMVTVGHLSGRMVVIVWTQRGATRHVILMTFSPDWRGLAEPDQ
jgi:uncharacterized DUF497 family protein